jgi:hypothetical protein
MVRVLQLGKQAILRAIHFNATTVIEDMKRRNA